MKRIVVILLFLIHTLGVYSQQGQLMVRENTQITGAIGSELSASISITNNGSQPINIIIKRIGTTIGSGQKTWFCWGNECFEEGVSALPLSKKLEPGETVDQFKSYLKAGLAEGFSSVTYVVFDKNNPQNATEFDVTYTVDDAQEAKAIFNSRQIIINDVYPNPVTDFAIVDYKVHDLESESKIIIHSVLGSIIAEYVLQPYETNLKIKTDTYNPGVYFYTLYIDGDGVMTRKLIVHK